VGNLVVDSEVLALVVDDEDADGTGAAAESLLDLGEELALVDDLEALLDLAGLGHDDELAVIADVDEAVLLEDRAEERVEDDGWGWVRDDARLLVELLREEVDAEVAVLAGLGGGGDADDLARALLEDDEVANANVVAGDGEGGVCGGVGGGDEGRLLSDGLLRGLLVAKLGVGGSVVDVIVLAHFSGFERVAVDDWGWDLLVDGLLLLVLDHRLDKDSLRDVFDLLRLLGLDELLDNLGLGSLAGAVGRRGGRRRAGAGRRRGRRLGVDFVLVTGLVMHLGRLVLAWEMQLVVNLVGRALLQVVKVVAGAEVDVVVLLLVLDLLDRELGRL